MTGRLFEAQLFHQVLRNFQQNPVELGGVGARNQGSVGLDHELSGGRFGQGLCADGSLLGRRSRLDERALDELEQLRRNDQAIVSNELSEVKGHLRVERTSQPNRTL